MIFSAHFLEHLVASSTYFDFLSRAMKENSCLLTITPKASTNKISLFANRWARARPDERLNFLALEL